MTLYFRTQWPNDGQLFIENLKGIAADDKRVLSLPFILAVLSALTLLARTLARYTRKSNPQVHEIDSNALAVGLDRREGMISRNGGVVVFLFMVTRIIACVALVGLSAVPGCWGLAFLGITHLTAGGAGSLLASSCSSTSGIAL
ncbi:hypothetical protein DFP72DRAFT_260049 [Ephemerocybe angulata]|uniref:Uncharacterized protein n=1 Tax=Ephemerocybe angulata TaxID=980116 RepID=A0A8H6H8X0_9AGAR|nr:hypothetical protein DFP72DRAFT_260049 [Tulosesus angulatus]